MTKNLIIVFVKNIKLGKVKTRLAKTIGNQAAFEVYSELVKITEHAIEALPYDKRIYFSDTIVDTKWANYSKAVQIGEDLGARMQDAFQKGFEDGYSNIILIGSDLPDIKASHLENGLQNSITMILFLDLQQMVVTILLAYLKCMSFYLKENPGVKATYYLKLLKK